MRAVFDVRGTTVITPRPRRAAAMLAPSLLTITAGRRLEASAPLTGSKSTKRISPLSIVAQTVGFRHIPACTLARCFPFAEGVLVRCPQFGASQQPYRLMKNGRTRSDALSTGIGVEKLNILLRKTHT